MPKMFKNGNKIGFNVDTLQEIEASSHEVQFWEVCPEEKWSAAMFVKFLRLQLTLKINGPLLWPPSCKFAVFTHFWKGFWISKNKVCREQTFTFCLFSNETVKGCTNSFWPKRCSDVTKRCSIQLFAFSTVLKSWEFKTRSLCIYSKELF